MNTPETMILWWTVIKILIDVFGWVIPWKYKPVIAIALWLCWSFAFNPEQWLDQVIFFGVTVGASAIGVNETLNQLKNNG